MVSDLVLLTIGICFLLSFSVATTQHRNTAQDITHKSHKRLSVSSIDQSPTLRLSLPKIVHQSATDIIASTVDPDLQCSNEYEYFPDPYDCRGFYQCINGRKQHSLCSIPLLWDVRVDGCTSISDCSQVVNSSVSPDEPTSTSHRPYLCENGDLTENTADCHSFFYCENNVWVGPSECPQDLYWSEAKKGCVQYEDSDCVSSSSAPTTTTTHAPYLCDNGDLTGNSADCKQYFYCENNKWVGPTECPGNLYWSSTLHGCVGYDQSDCSQISSSTSSN